MTDMSSAWRRDVPTTVAVASAIDSSVSPIGSCSVGCSDNSTNVLAPNATARATALSNRTTLRRFQNQYSPSGRSGVISSPSVEPMQVIGVAVKPLSLRRSPVASRMVRATSCMTAVCAG